MVDFPKFGLIFNSVLLGGEWLYMGTVLSLLKEAVQEYGLHLRVRCDRGVENV